MGHEFLSLVFSPLLATGNPQKLDEDLFDPIRDEKVKK